MAAKMQSLKLNTGALMPVVGYGMYMGDLTPDHEKTVQSVELALEIGYRHFDTAKLYGTEKMLGEVLNKQFKAGTLKRSDVFVTTKLWCNSSPQHLVVPSLKTQLADLGLDYVDLYLIHWPVPVKTGPELLPQDSAGNFLYESIDYLDTWRGMEECYKLGLTKAIGLSNFNSKQITRIMEKGSVKPAVLQIESHPLFNNNRLIKFSQEKGITITAFAPLGGNNPGYGAGQGKWPTVFDNEILKKIAQKHNKTIAQVALRYQTQRNIAIIPKSSSKLRMTDNLQCQSFDLTAEDIAEIDTCDKGYRQSYMFPDYPDHPFKEEF